MKDKNRVQTFIKSVIEFVMESFIPAASWIAFFTLVSFTTISIYENNNMLFWLILPMDILYGYLLMHFDDMFPYRNADFKGEFFKSVLEGNIHDEQLIYAFSRYFEFDKRYNSATMKKYYAEAKKNEKFLD